MFSGLVQEMGTIENYRDGVLTIRRSGSKMKVGDSIAINGVCLTVTKQKSKGKTHDITFDLSPETIEKTTLANLHQGTQVNLERALTMNQVLGGHIVQGHVDGIGHVAEVIDQGEMKTIWFEVKPEIMKFIVDKGSVAVDGVSLTSAELQQNRFSVALIPYTLTHTNMGKLKEGSPVNVEADIIGKYVTKYLTKS